MQETITILDLMRHGEPVGGRKYRGQTDDPLSEKGWQQMRDAVGDHQPWEQIVTSPLSRCKAFAEEMAQRYQLPLSTDPRLMEVGFGVWEGKTRDQLHAEEPGVVDRFKRDPVTQRPEGAEPLEDFHARVEAALTDIVQQYSGKHVLVVCHAGVIRMALAHVLHIPLTNAYRIDVPSAGITRLKIDGVGEHAHQQLLFHHGRL